MNKMFTSLSIMQLAEKGKLSLTDPVSKFVDTTWLPKDLADKITIHHLLSHTSGMGDMFREEFEKASIPSVANLEAWKPFIKVKKLNFEPGKKWDYSNAGMFLLGVVIENVSGINYFDYIRQNIYQPAGMTQSDVYDVNTNPHNLAIGYIFKADGTFQNNRNSMWTRGTPAGGGYSNLHDLHKFALALTAGKLVSADSQQKMYTDYMRREYGYGFQVFNHNNYKIVGHSGGAPGVNAVTLLEPKSGYIMIILSNYDNAVQGLHTYMLNRLKANLD
jgi:CubicO group peptidase (beta-lactamase class C family)